MPYDESMLKKFFTSMLNKNANDLIDEGMELILEKYNFEKFFEKFKG